MNRLKFILPLLVAAMLLPMASTFAAAWSWASKTVEEVSPWKLEKVSPDAMVGKGIFQHVMEWDSGAAGTVRCTMVVIPPTDIAAYTNMQVSIGFALSDSVSGTLGTKDTAQLWFESSMNGGVTWTKNVSGTNGDTALTATNATVQPFFKMNRDSTTVYHTMGLLFRCRIIYGTTFGGSITTADGSTYRNKFYVGLLAWRKQ